MPLAPARGTPPQAAARLSPCLAAPLGALLGLPPQTPQPYKVGHWSLVTRGRVVVTSPFFPSRKSTFVEEKEQQTRGRSLNKLRPLHYSFCSSRPPRQGYESFPLREKLSRRQAATLTLLLDSTAGLKFPFHRFQPRSQKNRSAAGNDTEPIRAICTRIVAQTEKAIAFVVDTPVHHFA